MVEPVSAEEAHEHTLHLQQEYQANKIARENSLEKKNSREVGRSASQERRRSSEETMVDHDDEDEQDRMGLGLRKRLKAVVKKATH